MRSRSFAAAWAQLKAYPSRMIAVVLAIVLGVGFVAATVVFGATYQAGLGAAVAARYLGADVVVTQDGTADQQALLEQVRGIPGIEYAEEQPQTWLSFTSPEARGTLRLDAIPGNPRLRWFGLTSGRWPTSVDQIVIDQATATSANLQLGSSLTLTDNKSAPVTVVGIADTSASAFSGAQSQGFASAAPTATISCASGTACSRTQYSWKCTARLPPGASGSSITTCVSTRSSDIGSSRTPRSGSPQRVHSASVTWLSG